MVFARSVLQRLPHAAHEKTAQRGGGLRPPRDENVETAVGFCCSSHSISSRLYCTRWCELKGETECTLAASAPNPCCRETWLRTDAGLGERRLTNSSARACVLTRTVVMLVLSARSCLRSSRARSSDPIGLCPRPNYSRYRKAGVLRHVEWFHHSRTKTECGRTRTQQDQTNAVPKADPS